jgi:hypothetical protein
MFGLPHRARERISPWKVSTKMRHTQFNGSARVSAGEKLSLADARFACGFHLSMLKDASERVAKGFLVLVGGGLGNQEME